MVRFSDILGKISKSHGAKPTSAKPLSDKEFNRSFLGDKVTIRPGPASVVGEEPTQEISKGIMEKLFQSVLDTPPKAGQAPGGEASTPPVARDVAVPRGEDKASTESPAIRGFRNHAELMKFASLLINDVEDILQSTSP